jgi:hypothetical protein
MLHVFSTNLVKTYNTKPNMTINLELREYIYQATCMIFWTWGPRRFNWATQPCVKLAGFRSTLYRDQVLLVYVQVGGAGFSLVPRKKGYNSKSNYLHFNHSFFYRNELYLWYQMNTAIKFIMEQIYFCCIHVCLFRIITIDTIFYKFSHT